MDNEIRIAGGPEVYRIWVDGVEIADAVTDLRVEMSARTKPEPDKIHLTLCGHFVFGEPLDEPVDVSGLGEQPLSRRTRPINGYYDPVTDEYVINTGDWGIRATSDQLYGLGFGE